MERRSEALIAGFNHPSDSLLCLRSFLLPLHLFLSLSFSLSIPHRLSLFSSSSSPPLATPFSALLLLQHHPPLPKSPWPFNATGSRGCCFFRPEPFASLHPFHTSVSHSLETGLSSRLALFHLCPPAFAQRHLGRAVVILVALSYLQTFHFLYYLVFGVLDAKD